MCLSLCVHVVVRGIDDNILFWFFFLVFQLLVFCFQFCLCVNIFGNVLGFINRNYLFRINTYSIL